MMFKRIKKINRLFSRDKMREFVSDQQGATAIEYALICSGLTLLFVVTIANIGSKVTGMFTTVDSML